MYEDLLFEYLNAIDGDWTPEADAYAPSYDEWNAMRVLAGLSAEEFDAYLRDIDTTTMTALSMGDMSTGNRGQAAA